MQIDFAGTSGLTRTVAKFSNASIDQVHNQGTGSASRSYKVEKPPPKRPETKTSPYQLAYQLATQRALARFLRRYRDNNNTLFENGHRRRLALSLKELWQWEMADRARLLNVRTRPKQRQKSQLLNLVRIPKAGSSALSITARALAGCPHDGYPCCGGYPENEACPAPDLNCVNLIRGCCGHFPKYDVFYDNTSEQQQLPIITSLRHPASRACHPSFMCPHIDPMTTVSRSSAFKSLYSIPKNGKIPVLK